ncbi:primosomal protein N', partial [Alphaproteobacteria bacterium]|nr:primosomal protein N' [Alphaproteobacteria bacterium]
MIYQVSGRTSRKSETGEVFIQTYDANNSLLKHIVSGNRDQFYESELFLRQKALLPPYCKLIAIILIGKDKNFLKTVSYKLKD